MKKFIIWILILVISNTMLAKDLGQRGQVYPISEVNLIELIYKKLTQLVKDGKMADIQETFKNNVEKAVMTPKGADLPRALVNQSRVFDASITLTKDIKNEKGQLIGSQGTIINPLRYKRLTKELIFINGDRENEIKYASKKLKSNANNKIILVNGNIKDTNIKIGSAVYFDQGSKLVTRFGLKATPSVVSQEGDNLIITEVAL